MKWSREDIIKRCCRDFNYKWPKHLSSGVMFFEGERITIQEFNKIAKMFK